MVEITSCTCFQDRLTSRQEMTVELNKDNVNIYIDNLYKDGRGFTDRIPFEIMKDIHFCPHCGLDILVGKKGEKHE